MIDDTNFDKPRTAHKIARRAIALHCAIAAAHGVSKQDINEWLLEEQLWNELTPHELIFMAQDEHPANEVMRMTWLVEAQVVLLWSIRRLNELPPPTGQCDTGLVVAAMPALFETTSPFIETAVLRSTKEIERAEETIYDIRCRVGQAICEGGEIPNGYDKDVLFFRHYSLSWVTGYCGQSWDKVTPDI